MKPTTYATAARAFTIAQLFAAAAARKVFADADGGLITDAIIDQKRARQEEIVAETNTIVAAAAAGKRDLTPEENDQIDDLNDEFDDLEQDIDRRVGVLQRAARLDQPRGRRTTAEGPQNRAGRDVDVDVEDERDDQGRLRGSGARVRGARSALAPNHGFKTQGEFFAAVHRAVTVGSKDERLLAAAASTVSTEGVGADGGFAVPPEYRDRIHERVFNEDSLISRCDVQVSERNSMTFPVDNTTPWDSASAGGIQAYWEGETNAIAQSKVKLDQATVRLHKLAALVPVTEELLEDNAAMGSYVGNKAAEKIDFKISDAIVRGNGVGMPLGYLNSPALVTQAAESGPQTADTIVAANVVKMYSRMPTQNRKSAIWLIHPDAEPQLPQMTIGNQPVYLPPGGLSGNQYGLLMGRPVVPHEVCNTVGDLGDIMFADFNAYLAMRKAAGLKAQTSIHLWFDQDLTAFKFTIRIAGQPWNSAPITPRSGTTTRSPFIVLAAR